MESYNTPKEWSTEKYYNYQRLIKEKLNHYVNAESLSVLKEVH